MRVVKSVAAMQRIARDLKRRGRIGLVPTMGYLHEGHLRLVRAARRQSDFVVVSIFVNPMQFGPKEDYRRYPRDFGRDRRLLQSAGADFIFCPGVEEMYPDGFATFVEVERLGEGLCGKSRPGHFRGVTTVVTKLFNTVLPDVAVFGAKDAQQAFVIRRMTRDLGFQTRIEILPTARESDGLAMSSRNVYLTPVQRAEAPALHRSLVLARHMIEQGEREAAKVKAAMRRLIKRESDGRIDYVEIVDTDELRQVRTIDGEVLVALAVFFDKTRLIDNVIVRG
ncbi:MAG TPA: pantoate--beta-alanine ligase [bacterium]|nr:pantoate--beta-alanine ligase [bacterium]